MYCVCICFVFVFLVVVKVISVIESRFKSVVVFLVVDLEVCSITNIILAGGTGKIRSNL